MNSFEYNGLGNGELKLSSIATERLREKLNRIYASMRMHCRTFTAVGLFEYLWDLKELAIVEGRQSVSVPSSWLKELEDECERGTASSSLRSSCCGSRITLS